MPDEITLLWQQAADAQRKASQDKRPGVIKEFKNGAARILMGIGPNGEEYLTPWIYPDQHMGLSRHSLALKANMNVMVHLPQGDPAQAYFTPLSPNQEIPRPDHADAAGEKADTMQLECVRSRTDPDQWDIWVTEKAGTVTQGAATTGGVPLGASGAGSLAKGSSGERRTPAIGKYQANDTTCGEGTKALAKLRVTKKDGKIWITGRIGTNCRFSAHPDGAKIKRGSHYFVAYKDMLLVDQPPIVGPDPIPDDDQ